MNNFLFIVCLCCIIMLNVKIGLDLSDLFYYAWMYINNRIA